MLAWAHRQYEIEFSPISTPFSSFFRIQFSTCDAIQYLIKVLIKRTNNIQKFIAWSALNWRDFVFACFFSIVSADNNPKIDRIPFQLAMGKIFTRSLIILPSKLTFPRFFFILSEIIFFSIVHFISWNTQKLPLSWVITVITLERQTSIFFKLLIFSHFHKYPYRVEKAWRRDFHLNPNRLHCIHGVMSSYQMQEILPASRK